VFDVGTRALSAELAPPSIGRTPTDPEFGKNVAVNAGKIAVSDANTCLGVDSLPCGTTLHLYSRSGAGSWTARALRSPDYSPEDETYSDRFGTGVALSDRTLVVGDSGALATAPPRQPQVHFFTHDARTDAWIPILAVEVTQISNHGIVGDNDLFAFAQWTASEAWVEIYRGVFHEARIDLPSPAYGRHLGLKDGRLIVSTGDTSVPALVISRTAPTL
jgi:hypothetical protein